MAIQKKKRMGKVKMEEGENAIFDNRPDDLDALLTSGQITVHTPIHGDLNLLGFAAMKNRWECVRVLLEHKAKVDQTSAGMVYSPLFMAARDGSDEVVRVLIQNGANVNAIYSHRKRTALHAAAFQGRAKCVKTLIDAKANMEIKDIHEFTPLRDAILRGMREVIKVLVDAKCKRDYYDSWTFQFVAQRRRTKQTIIAIIGSIRWRLRLGRDMANLVGSLVWDQRDDPAWEK